ncbi:C-X-C chemokine receptor type 3-like [Haplochromis burtoni]|uniref:C-X-C chemokine receptor type 3-like n=1 Tax=Haplochromis burtoni TaxID=8153 RepID=UPI001C2D6C2D|nr:C-X-C chemokine receptor type 3-like [Haplochromis burtoni]
MYRGDICDLTENVNFEAVFIPVLYSVVFVVGLLGNGLLLGILAQSRKTWSVTDIFILHLGVADILMLVTLPIWAVQYAQSDGWTFGTPLCMISGSVFMINFYCGILLLACISLDRYLSIVHATQMYSRKKPWVAQASCLMMWFFSLLLSIIDWIFLEEMFDDRRGRRECVHNYRKFDVNAEDSWRLASRMIYLIVGFVLPSGVMIFCYSRILDQLRCGAQSLQKQRAFKVIVAVVVVFFICWAPYNFTLLVETGFFYPVLTMMEDEKITVTGEDLDWSDFYENYNYSDSNGSYEGGDICSLTETVNFEAVFIPVLYSVVFVVGLLGNGLLLRYWLGVGRPGVRQILSSFHLGVADILMLVTLPIWAVQNVYIDSGTTTYTLIL